MQSRGSDKSARSPRAHLQACRARRELVGITRILDPDTGRASLSIPPGKEGVEIVNDVEGVGPDDGVPEADAAEQHQAVDFDDEAGLDTTYLNADAKDREANEADVIEQAFIVPADDDWDDDH
jgi:hypothetical protein